MKAQLFALAAALGASVVGAAPSPDKHDYPTKPPHGKPEVTPEKLMKAIKLEKLLAGAQKLEDIAYATPERNRVFGGKGHNDTVEYLYKELKKTGYYDVSKQEQVHLWSFSNQTLTVNGEKTEAETMTYSPGGDVTADIVLVKNLGCNAEDFPAEVAGKVALIVRGECEFGLKAANAGNAEAAGALIYNNVDGELSGTLGSPTNPAGPYPPTIGLSKAIGDDFASRLGSETLSANLNVYSRFENRTTFNVIATTKTGNQDNVIALGAHSDSVEAGPGINDDGSGTIGNLIVAKALTKFSTPNAVRFLWWTAEEYGLLGSQYYVDSLSPEEIEKIRLYLNFDMTASPNYATLIYDGDGSTFNLTGPSGSSEIEAMFQGFYEDQGLAHFPTEFDGRSDYDGFISVGIPAGGVFTGAEGLKTEEQAAAYGGEAGVAYDINYHGAGDNMTNINHEGWLLNTKATAFSVAKYALSTEDLPPKDPIPPPPTEKRSMSTERAERLCKAWKQRCTA
ncbi:Leucyl aminopeptidase yscIV [Onygenales sp. PD_40]|nr:Leucyl aminopeptidase yscIV [Onygenales sp. PD_40]